ncbi:Uncharacterised protein [Acinetobacter baumannii]|uniref:Lipoprotein n=1 Tax=Acinetobacter baumannii TaxID=470 RepID=A0AA90HUX7_ACIBA|nr:MULTISPECIES: hypothetical protein [Acinetobacter calcoaceticus/baumannii complex]ANC36147.1 hypothetical protein Aba3207_05715 [Acinetobacter baumannii]AYX87979.1 hypothetical protein EGX84_16290 [Acinetobacter baumannii]EHU1211635.1 hypothetical protein [Acinetobacter nosocomialis]EHU1450438.1 hypothetical protein [Acinetobacter baumannii]EHU1490325.1 hypothetical protein [Acinetobacter baumannii]
MKKILFALVVGSSLVGCATTYKAPVTLNQSASEQVSATKDQIFKAAQRALAINGEQIMSANADAGVISTAARDYRLTPDLADCGTTMGIDYLKDNRTSTKVAYNILIADNSLDVRTTLQGDYKVGDVTQNITLTCVSRGVLEQKMIQKIKAEIK